MNIAVVHPYPVHATAVGGVTRVYELVRFLARAHRVSVFTHDVEGAEAAQEELAEAGIAHRAFARRPASRLRKLVSWADRSVPYYVHHNLNPALARALAAADAADPFDLVHVEFGYMAPALRLVGPWALRSLGEQEAMPVVLERLRQVPWRARTRYERLAVLARRRALAFDRRTLPSFDLIYGITPEEQDYLRLASGKSVGLLPHVVAMVRFVAPRPFEHAPATVMFVGNFRHRPNVHAAEWFVRRAWPIVRATIPDATFEIVGAGLDAALAARLAAPGVVPRGYQEDLPACYRQAAIVVNPVHSGGGMRGKVLEAFAAGCALVSTTTGLNGIAAVHDQHCLVADAPEAFAQAIVRYLGSAALRRRHGAAAVKLVANHYDAPMVFARFERECIDAVRRKRTSAAQARTIA